MQACRGGGVGEVILGRTALRRVEGLLTPWLRHPLCTRGGIIKTLSAVSSQLLFSDFRHSGKVAGGVVLCVALRSTESVERVRDACGRVCGVLLCMLSTWGHELVTLLPRPDLNGLI